MAAACEISGNGGTPSRPPLGRRRHRHRQSVRGEFGIRRRMRREQPGRHAVSVFSSLPNADETTEQEESGPLPVSTSLVSLGWPSSCSPLAAPLLRNSARTPRRRSPTNPLGPGRVPARERGASSLNLCLLVLLHPWGLLVVFSGLFWVREASTFDTQFRKAPLFARAVRFFSLRVDGFLRKLFSCIF